MHVVNHCILALFTGILLVSACRPTDIRTESREIMPEDSLSRVIADTVPSQSLDLVWSNQQEQPSEMRLPFVVRFGPEGTIYVSDPDPDSNRLVLFTESGEWIRNIELDEFEFPYLAGFRGDTVLVLNRGKHALLGIVGDEVVYRLDVPKAPMSYIVPHGNDFYFKATGADEMFTGFVARLDSTGRAAKPRLDFTEPFWRYSGSLRSWEEDIISLSGFRPFIDVLHESGQTETVRLQGFDSPMLARSRLFLTGEVSEAPLLTPSAVPYDSLLYVLNLRANVSEAWVRIDAYDRSGMLRSVAEQPIPDQTRRFFPVDLDVRVTADDGLEFVILFQEPTPHLRLYKWNLRRPPKAE